MKVLVIGTGVIGSIYGYVLARVGHHVSHYVRPGQSARQSSAIQLHLLDGRTAEPMEIEALYPARLVEAFSPNDAYELILVSLKHYDVGAILPQLAVGAGRADVLFFNNWWDDFAAVDSVLPGRYLWGFPVAGGGWIDDRLDGALLDTVHLGEIDGTLTPRLANIKALFESAALKVDLEPDILAWLWVHFATEAGLISSAIAAGSVDTMLDDLPRLEAAILAGREGLEICRARGVDVTQVPDAQPFYAPVEAVATGIRDFYATSRPARRILERHTGGAELKQIYWDVASTGRDLGVATPRLTALGPDVEAWNGLASRSSAMA
jgi:2-dehydropantoate 2-reductase